MIAGDCGVGSSLAIAGDCGVGSGLPTAGDCGVGSRLPTAGDCGAGCGLAIAGDCGVGSGLAIGGGSGACSGLAIGGESNVVFERPSGFAIGVSSGAAMGANGGIAIDDCRIGATSPAIFSNAGPGGNVTSIPFSVGGFSGGAIGCNGNGIGGRGTAWVMGATSLRFIIALKSVGAGAWFARGGAPDTNCGRLGKSESSTSIKISTTIEPPIIAAIALVTSTFFKP